METTGFVIELEDAIKDEEKQDIFIALSRIKGVKSIKHIKSESHTDIIIQTKETSDFLKSLKNFKEVE